VVKRLIFGLMLVLLTGKFAMVRDEMEVSGRITQLVYLQDAKISSRA
jgi:hypothetical protein